MTTPNDQKPDRPAATGSVRYDPLLDPLPQPEVEESDTATAWGRWEEMLASSDAAEEEEEPPPPNFEDTVPMDGLDLPAPTKSRSF